SSRSLAEFIPTIAKQEHCDYIETRLGSPEALGPALGRLSCSGTFFHHVLDLRPTVETLFDRLHKSCFQRKIRRAETESLSYAEGTFDSILKHFYSLFVLTRRRHGVPPQPFAWFRNLRDQFGDAMKIGMVSKNNRPVASMLTLRYKTTVVYKYGCSDAAFHKFGGMPFLFWHTIQRAKSEGATELDLGRSDVDADGLIAFKNHLGATATTLTYYRYPASLAAPTVLSKLMHSRKVSSFFAHLPPALLRTAGNLFYRHVG
ncbi:MAG TPA: GNAT family N-acetyltransferase, partial [Terriglobales bacterium]